MVISPISPCGKTHKKVRIKKKKTKLKNKSQNEEKIPKAYKLMFFCCARLGLGTRLWDDLRPLTIQESYLAEGLILFYFRQFLHQCNSILIYFFTQITVGVIFH